MNLDRFKPTTVYTIYIASTPEKVWQALTSAEFSTKYFLGNSVEVEPRIGGAFIVNWPALIEKLGRTVVTYEIEPAGHAVKLTMSEAHDRPIEDDILSGGRQGWPAILSSLKSLLETGEPLVVKMAPPERMLAALKKLGLKTPS